MLQAMTRLAHSMAIIGGIVLLAIVVMVSANISGRALGWGEITGTYEILEAGVAFAIFCFFPICQLYGGHATVDVFTSGLPKPVLRWLFAFWEIVLAGVIVFISWRLSGGVERYLNNGETTFFLQFPVWWAYAASFSASVMAGIVALYCAWARLQDAIFSSKTLPDEG